MARPASNRPTDGELVILKVLWQINGGTIREVQNALAGIRPIGYTTVQKNLHIMLAKGLVDRTEMHGVSVYRAKQSEQQTQRKMAKDLLVRVFGGSTKKLVMNALAGKRTTAQEMAQLEAMLDRIDQE